MPAGHDVPKPDCPHCGAQGRDVEMQIATVRDETYFCNSCSKLFRVDKRTGKVLSK